MSVKIELRSLTAHTREPCLVFLSCGIPLLNKPMINKIIEEITRVMLLNIVR